MPDSAHGGEAWESRSTDTLSELGTLWRASGVSVEWAPLRTVLLYRPGAEIDDVQDPSRELWSERVDSDLVREQHQGLEEAYLSAGVEVLTLEPGMSANGFRNLTFMRDLFAMTPLGAIIGRPASATRAGEEVLVAAALARYHVPIVGSVLGWDHFEGADLILASPELALVGTGLRTSRNGAEHVASVLRKMGYQDAQVIQTTYGCGHLDGVLSVVSDKLALVYPRSVSYEAYAALKRHGFAVEELPDPAEAADGMAINIVPLSRDQALMPAGNPVTARLLARYGVQAISVNVSEIKKMGGAIHCLTGVVHRA